jgi:hypothetical protein
MLHVRGGEGGRDGVHPLPCPWQHSWLPSILPVKSLPAIQCLVPRHRTYLQKSPGQNSAQILLKFIKALQQKGLLPGGLLFLGFKAKVAQKVSDHTTISRQFYGLESTGTLGSKIPYTSVKTYRLVVN